MSQPPIGDVPAPGGQAPLVDPRTAYASERFPGQQQDYPGWTEAMDPVPDHGEDTYEGNHRLDGLTALITGADSGIGRAVAIAYAREGADVAFTYLPEEDSDAAQTVQLVEDAGQRALALPGDLRDEAFCQDVVAQTVDTLGRLDILVNNAGFQMTIDSLEDLETSQLERTFETNVYSLIWLAKAALPHLHPGASIINTTSIQGYHPSPTLLDYAATKAAIVSLTHSLAGSLGERGIRVNAVAPGPVWTPLQPPTQPVEKIKNFGQDTPLGRAGQPAELAAAYVYLADPASTYVSGTVIGVTGGRYLG
ncbi:NAD(P)-dependent dehydrogenase [Bacillus sp. SRB_336]|nr:NAD(P)-dependent dehydrogenase [Bacillus sp. SRB_336]